jgi:hypothetical protein
MVNVQDVFDKVISGKYYSEHNGAQLMCHALKNAARGGTITAEEFILATKEIRSYLGGFGSLGGLLDFKGGPWHFAARLYIYQDWANKPIFNVK